MREAGRRRTYKSLSFFRIGARWPPLTSLTTLRPASTLPRAYRVSNAPPMTPQLPTAWTLARVAATLALFLASAVCEVGGGWCVWKAVHGPPASPHRWFLIAPGVVALSAYGFVAASQPFVSPSASFSRTFAVYGGVFIGVSYLWGWVADKQRPDVGDGVGACIALAGVATAWFWPRAKAA